MTTPRRRRFGYLPNWLLAAVLIVSPFVLPSIGGTSDTLSRILIWGLFGLGFDLIFGFTGLLSFGQVGVLRLGRLHRLVSAGVAHHPQRVRGAADRTDRRRDHRRRGGRAGAQALGHLFRDDHRGVRRDVLLSRELGALSLDRRRERPAQRAQAEHLPLGSFRLHLHRPVGALRHAGGDLLCRLRHRAAHRRLAVRACADGDPRQPDPRQGGGAQHPALQADGVRHRRRPMRGWPAGSRARCRATCRQRRSASRRRGSW